MKKGEMGPKNILKVFFKKAYKEKKVNVNSKTL